MENATGDVVRSGPILDGEKNTLITIHRPTLLELLYDTSIEVYAQKGSVHCLVVGSDYM